MIGAGSGFFIARIITLILVIIVVVDLLGLIPAIIIDIKKNKFYFTKWILISFIGVIVIIFMIRIIAQLISPPMDLYGNPPSNI